MNTTASNTPNLPAVPTYGSTDVAQFGNNLLIGLVQALSFDEFVSEQQAKGEAVKQHIGFELTRAVLDLAEKNEELNIYAIFDSKVNTEKLNTRLLEAMGIIERKIVGEEIVTTWTDTKVRDLYVYTLVDKDKDPEEYKRRFDNRKRLNARISDACKAAIALRDGKTKAADLTFEEVEGVVTPVINHAPKEISGDNADGKVTFGQRSVATGASASPTLASLVKIATNKHKTAEGELTERTDKGGDRSGEAKIAMTDEAFGGMVNNLKRAVAAQEGVFTPDMVKQMQSLVPVLEAAVKAATATKAAPKK